MTVLDQAKRYLNAIPPAISGQRGHNQTLIAARALVRGFDLSDADAMNLLQEWNRSCQPPWTDKELDHKISEARTKDFDKPVGYLLSGRHKSADRPKLVPTSCPPQVAQPVTKAEYDLSEAETVKFPKPIENGFEVVLRTCFQPGEGVRVMNGMTDDGIIRCDPNGGVVLSREEWLDRLAGGRTINNMFHRLGGPQVGVYLGVNPIKQDGRMTDGDVTSHRHCLVEFDDIGLEEQWLLFTKSNLPCACVIYSGGKSLHAWVKIGARDRKEYDERVNLVYNHFAAYKPDPHNKNPSRLSRCPDAERGQMIQYLLATDIGAASFTEWSRQLLVQGIGITYTERQILDYVAETDNQTVAGNLWLRKGSASLLVGPSGIGKSSLGRQIAMTWALGLPCTGLAPNRPLRILMVQAENDIADLHDMDLGIAEGLGIRHDSQRMAQICSNLTTNHNVADTGESFIRALQRLLDHHMPDLVIVDPLLSFIGNDISKQEVVGQFCRNWLNPVLVSSNVHFMAIHHTGKPPKEFQPTRKHESPRPKTMAEWAYLGLGSSELTNWARAIMILNPIPGGTFELHLAKRGRRAEAIHPNGNHTETLLLRHDPNRIFWIAQDPPEEVATACQEQPPKPDRRSKELQVASANLHEFLSACSPEGESHKDLKTRLSNFASDKLHINLLGGSLARTVDQLIANNKLKRHNGLYFKGQNA